MAASRRKATQEELSFEDNDDEAGEMPAEESADAPRQVKKAVKKAPPLPGQEGSRRPARIAELGEMPIDELVRTLKYYNVNAHVGIDRNKLLLMFLRAADKAKLHVEGEGQLEVMPDGYGFLRAIRNSFLTSPDDLYVGADLVKKYGLRPGMTITGRVRRGHRKDKYFALADVTAINGFAPDAAADWTPFDDMTPVFPDTRIRLENHDEGEFSSRVVDLVAPIGYGQRGLIVSPPRAGKTVLMKDLARAITQNNKEVKLVVFLVDERPEEVTDMQRTIDGEVIFSTFDESPNRHIQVAERVTDRVRSLVEAGFDVVLLMDSLTRLGRAFNSAAKGGKIMSGGLEANALQKPKRMFSSARNVEGGGSLTIIATALIETNSRMDEVIFEEFKGTGNMEIVLSRQIAEQRFYPAIDILKSGTRNAELLLDPQENLLIKKMYANLASETPVDALEKLMTRLKKTGSNAEFLLGLMQQDL